MEKVLFVLNDLIASKERDLSRLREDFDRTDYNPHAQSDYAQRISAVSIEISILKKFKESLIRE